MPRLPISKHQRLVYSNFTPKFGMCFSINKMNEIVKFRYPDSSVNLISVAGIGAIGAGAVNSMREYGLTGVDYFL